MGVDYIKFWNSSSKIDWVRSLAIEGQASIVMIIVILFIAIISYEKDFKNILIGIIIGVLGTIIVGCLLNDVYIDVRVGDIEEITNKTDLIK